MTPSYLPRLSGEMEEGKTTPSYLARLSSEMAGGKTTPSVNSRAMFTTHSRVMFTSDDRVGVYHFKESFALLLLITPPFFGRVAGNFHLE
jgi:hypothetical protein